MTADLLPRLDLDASPVHLRRLTLGDAPRFEAHLLRLDPASRRLRFGGVVNETFVAGYAARVLGTARVIGLFVEGELRGAAELHTLGETGTRGEAAFSLETPFRGAGHGARLFASLRRLAVRSGIRTLLFQCLSENRAMLAIARRNGASLRFESGEAHATLALEAATARPMRAAPASAASARRGVEVLRDHLDAGEAAFG